MVGTAPGLADVLLAPNERVLWPIVIAVAVFALAGLWIARRERGADTDAGGPDAGHDAGRAPDDTRAE